MRNFNYTIKDEIGIHARPAGMLAKEAKKYESSVVVSTGEKTAEAVRLMAVMGLGVKCGQEVAVAIMGPDEDDAYKGIKKFFEDNL